VKQRCRGLTPALTATAEPLVGLGVSPSRATEEPVRVDGYAGIKEPVLQEG